MTRPPVPQRGFTILEVLVAVVVLSIGLLGVASLQYAGLKSSQDGYGRTQAAFLAYAITDSMRANPNAARLGDYDIGTGSDGSAGMVPCSGPIANCTPTQMAAWDLFLWKQSLRTMLPTGNGTVMREIDPATGDVTAVITVSWVSMIGDNAPQNVQIRLDLG